MSRVYIAVPVDPDHAAGALASVAKAHRESPEEAAERGYTGPPRILRLPDRTDERLARLEAEHDARVGELERLPMASEAEPAPVRPEPGSVRCFGCGSRTAEEERADAVAYLAKRATVYSVNPSEEDAIRGSENAQLAHNLRDGAHVGAASRPTAPTPIIHVPVESAGADGARLSEHRMCSDLAVDGMSPFYAEDGSRRWLRRNFASPSDIEAAPTTAVAYAAMHAAKGAR